MMMQRSHFKDTLFAQFIAANLQYDADCLQHELSTSGTAGDDPPFGIVEVGEESEVSA